MSNQNDKPNAGPSHGDLYEEGLKVRRQVVGDDYVERSLSNASEFSMPLQELATVCPFILTFEFICPLQKFVTIQ